MGDTDHLIRLAALGHVRRHGFYKSSTDNPVCFATLASMRGPISSPSWKAKT
ncbi:MAG: hypothetical protein ACYCY8_03520 [Burkholderiales bacterium]